MKNHRICTICESLSAKELDKREEWTCEICGASYIYDEGVVLDLTPDDYDAIRSRRNVSLKPGHE